jgi:hypothetical protein
MKSLNSDGHQFHQYQPLFLAAGAVLEVESAGN